MIVRRNDFISRAIVGFYYYLLRYASHQSCYFDFVLCFMYMLDYVKGALYKVKLSFSNYQLIREFIRLNKCSR